MNKSENNGCLRDDRSPVNCGAEFFLRVSRVPRWFGGHRQFAPNRWKKDRRRQHV